MLGILTGLLRGGRYVPRKGAMQLNSKNANKHFVKGNGCRRMGAIVKGQYQPKDYLQPQYVVPDLTDFPLKPYVAINTPNVRATKPPVPTKKP